VHYISSLELNVMMAECWLKNRELKNSSNDSALQNKSSKFSCSELMPGEILRIRERIKSSK